MYIPDSSPLPLPDPSPLPSPEPSPDSSPKQQLWKGEYLNYIQDPSQKRQLNVKKAKNYSLIPSFLIFS